MAAITPPTDVRTSGEVRSQLVQYGSTVTFGSPLYLDTADNKYKLCDSNVSLTTASIKGIALTPGVDTGYGLMATAGILTLTGSTLVVGRSYFIGQTAGSIIPAADLATGDWVSRIGTAYSATQMLLSLEATNIQHA